MLTDDYPAIHRIPPAQYQTRTVQHSPKISQRQRIAAMPEDVPGCEDDTRDRRTPLEKITDEYLYAPTPERAARLSRAMRA